MCKHTDHNPLHCILPPHILDEIVERGNPEQQVRAQRSLAEGANFRQQRKVGFLKMTAARIRPAATTEKQRTVYDAQNGTNLPGVVARQEGDPATGDNAVDEAYLGSGETYDLFKEVYGRNSIDNNGMALDSSVHFGVSYDNAFWNGQQMVYGDGDEDRPPNQRIFNRFTIDIAIIGHELAHGVTSYEANLVYKNQPGALNEHMSDVFGSLVKQRILGQTAALADWIVGEGLFTENVNGVGIRSMKNPGSAYDDPLLGKDPQPGHMDDYVSTTKDNGGVHINSGIPNKAFYLAATAIGGNAWEKTGRIWYETLRGKLRANSEFNEAARMTVAVAGELYGVNGAEQAAVRQAWESVGLPVSEEEEQEGCWPALRRAIGI